MCGHVGIITNIKAGFIKSEVDMFINMLYTDALRGDDATGVCLVSKTRDITVLKEATEAADFLRAPDAYALVKDAVFDGRVLLGHNRKKTIGQNRDVDAHPFVINDNTVFFHNGTLNTHKHLADVDVDSHALGIHLAKANGDAKEIEKLLENVYGAYACVWYDQELNKVFLLRNKERPLFLAKTKANAYVYASEPWMIYGGVARNGGSVETMEALKEHVLYSIDLDNTMAGLKAEELTVKKAPASPNGHSQSTTVTTGKPTGGNNKGPSFRRPAGSLSKNQAKRIIRELGESYVCFWAEEYFPLDGGDHLIVGTDEDYPGVIFKARFNGHTDAYVEEEILGRLIHGNCAAPFYDKDTGLITCWTDKPQVSKPSNALLKTRQTDEQEIQNQMH